MIARLTTMRVKADLWEELLKFGKEQVFPAHDQAPGFAGDLVLVDPGTFTVIQATLWTSEEDADRYAGSEENRRRREKIQAMLDGAPERRSLSVYRAALSSHRGGGADMH